MAFPDPVINGLGAAELNELQLSYTPFVGGQQGGTYEGPDSVIRPMIQTLTNLGYSVQYSKSQSPISKLVFSAAFQSVGNQPVAPNADYKDTWELVRNSSQKELMESDHPLLSAMDETNTSELKKYISNPGLIYHNVGAGSVNYSASFTNGGDTIGTPPINPVTGVPYTSFEAAIYLCQLYFSGVKTVELKQPILKLTRTTSPLYTLAWAVNNSDAVMTTATMLADSGLPNDFAIPLADLETRLIARSGGLIQQARADGVILNFGWLKDFVGSSKHGRERIQFNITYSFGLWDYGTYGSPI